MDDSEFVAELFARIHCEIQGYPLSVMHVCKLFQARIGAKQLRFGAVRDTLYPVSQRNHIPGERGEVCELQLVECLDRLADEIRVVRDVLDAIHDDFNWVTRNGQRSDHLHQHSILKEMALDPTTDDWGERLRILRDTAVVGPDELSANEHQGPSTPNETTPATEPGRLF